jgi:phage terminase small subunit
MARHKKPAALDAAQGYPSRLKSKAERRQLEQGQIRELIAAEMLGMDLKAAPTFLDQGHPVAAQIWRDHAPSLIATQRLAPDFRLTFSMFCYYMAEWIEAVEEIRVKGRTQRVKTVSGSTMERDRPAIRHREQAHRNVMELSARFGLTATDLSGLMRNYQNIPASDLFAVLHSNLPASAQPRAKTEDPATPPPASPPQETAPAPAGPVSVFGAFNSVPPDQIN